MAINLKNEFIIAFMSKEFVHTNLLGELREVFIRGEVPVGQKVPERELCERFGVSRTPLREALKVLAAEGQVELLPNRGARVLAMSLEVVEGLFDVAGALEALAGEQACERVTDDELAELAALHARMKAAFEQGQMKPYYEFNRQIHEAIVRAARNPVLVGQYAILNGRIRRIRFESPMSPEIWARAMAEHEGMMNALTRRDAAAMASILKTHLKHKSQAILQGLREAAALETVPARRRAPRKKEAASA
jgi:DNA-binding GntR family transcriptional regulator